MNFFIFMNTCGYKCGSEFKRVYYRRYVDDISVSFKSQDHLPAFLDCSNKCQPCMNFSSEQKRKIMLGMLEYMLASVTKIETLVNA